MSDKVYWHHTKCTAFNFGFLELTYMSSAICQQALKPRLPQSTLSDLFAFIDEDLAKFARIALQLPVTQVFVEREFSSLKLVLKDLRMCLNDDAVDATLVLLCYRQFRISLCNCYYNGCS